MTTKEFDSCRDSRGNINLINAFRIELDFAPTLPQRQFLQEVMDIHPIRSRQLAAIALATAKHLSPTP